MQGVITSDSIELNDCYNIGAYNDNPVMRGLKAAAGCVDYNENTPWDSREKAISEIKSEAFETINRKSTKNVIKNTIYHIDKTKSFNCLDYLCYLVFCKKIKSNIKYYEELRRLIVSEESMFHNYFNIDWFIFF